MLFCVLIVHSFLLPSTVSLCVYSLFIHSSVKEHSSCFQFLAVMNRTAIKNHVHVWTCLSFFSVKWHVGFPRSQASAYLTLWENARLFPRVAGPFLVSHQPCKKSSSCFVSLPVVGIVSFYFILPILLGVWVFFCAQWNIYKHLTMVLICISLVINGVEHPFMCFAFVIIITSLMKSLRLSDLFPKIGYFLTIEFQAFLMYSS